MLPKSLFVKLMLGLVFAVLVLRVHSCSHVQEGKELEVTRKGIPAAQKELPDGIPTTSARNMGLGGRKMASHKGQENETEKDQGLQGRASEDISGMDDNATKKSPGSSQDKLNDQDQTNPNKLGKKTLKSACLGTPMNERFHVPSTNSKYYQDSKSVPDNNTNLESPSGSDRQVSPKGEMQRLLVATKRIVSLMHKDYSGMNRPRHKPPINNHVPIH